MHERIIRTSEDIRGGYNVESFKKLLDDTCQTHIDKLRPYELVEDSNCPTSFWIDGYEDCDNFFQEAVQFETLVLVRDDQLEDPHLQMSHDQLHEYRERQELARLKAKYEQ